MIQYTLKCENDHHVDSWFASSAAFDTLQKSGHLMCETCGSTQVEKAIMAPRVATSADVEETTAPVLAGASSDVEKALAELREKVESSSDYVGDKFATEARAMHLGEQPERPIYGQANANEAKALIEDGIPVTPLPFRPTRKAN